MRKFIKIAASYISRANQYTKDEEEQIEYAIRIFMFENLKILGILVLFSLAGYPIPAVLAVGAMIIIRPFIGGYHEDTQIRCFTFTLIIIGSVIYLSINLNIDFISRLILSLVSLYCIWHQAPVINPKMQLTRPELIKRNRTVGISIAAVFVLISMIFNHHKIVSNTLLWTIVFQALLLFNKRNIQH